MSRSVKPYRIKLNSHFFNQFFQPVWDAIPETPVLESRGDRPLKMTFEDQLKMLVFFHLEEHVSARHMLQVLEQDDFARNNIAPEVSGPVRKGAILTGEKGCQVAIVG